MIPRPQLRELQDRFKAGGAEQPAFRHIGLPPPQRDFLRTESCHSLSGQCNPHTSLAHYRKGDYVPPEELKVIHEKTSGLPEEDEDEEPTDREFDPDQEDAAEARALVSQGKFTKAGVKGIYAKLNSVFSSMKSAMGSGSGSGASSGSGGSVQASTVFSGFWGGGGGSAKQPVVFSDKAARRSDLQPTRELMSGPTPIPPAPAAPQSDARLWMAAGLIVLGIAGLALVTRRRR